LRERRWNSWGVLPHLTLLGVLRAVALDSWMARRGIGMATRPRAAESFGAAGVNVDAADEKLSTQRLWRALGARNMVAA
jgi:hypothetical protein